MNSNFICFLSLFALGIPLSTAQTQILRLYNATGCNGVPYRNMTNSETYTLPSNGTVRSIHVVGLWLVQQNSTGTGTILHQGSAPGGCTSNLPQLNGTLQVRMYGDSAMKDSTSITLYALKTFGGGDNRFSSSSPNTNINMKSYWFTGSNSTWIVYTGANYTGTATCLLPSNTVKQQGWGHTFETDRSINVRSIQRSTTCPSRSGGGSSISSFFSTIWSTGVLALVSVNLLNQRAL